MTADELRDACLALPGAVETWPFGDHSPSVFKVGEKMFAVTFLDRAPLTVGLKCDPDLAVALRASWEEITPGWHLNKRHWNSVRLDGSLPREMVLDMIEDSYDLVKRRPPRTRAKGGGT